MLLLLLLLLWAVVELILTSRILLLVQVGWVHMLTPRMRKGLHMHLSQVVLHRVLRILCHADPFRATRSMQRRWRDHGGVCVPMPGGRGQGLSMHPRSGGCHVRRR